MDKGSKMFVVLIAIVIIAAICVSCAANFNDTTYEVTVTNKENINRGNNGYYLVYCEDDSGNYYEFKNEDTLIRGKVDSSRYYNKIEVGERYRFKVVGFRFPLLSWYQNIIEMEKLE